MTDETPVQPNLSSDDRPSWVPGSAVWANGQWYLNGIAVDRLGLNPALVKLTPAERDAQYKAADAAQKAKITEGLPPGYYRSGGLIWGRDGKPAHDLPGGYSDDGSHRPGYDAHRAARVAAIKAAAAEQHQAIRELEEATQHKHEADARAHRAHHVSQDA